MVFTENFLKAFELLMIDEGGFVNDPADPGGATKYGITQRTYERYLKRRVTIDDMKNMPIEHAQEIYYVVYWTPLLCDLIFKAGIAICIFNTGVLYGTGTSTKLAQRTVSLMGANIKIDSVMGGETIKVLNMAQEKDFIKVFSNLLIERIAYLCSENPKLNKFKKGWTNRTQKLIALADIDTTRKV